ncbi:MAG: T9SS C-terminal target domain-containing protein [Calditrichaceae bacterium]|nr:T9SS C-terminal target domain-containing protein [Calditrichia bacterium]NUQ43953.1 T9SS C-terminal target domain-containing protein [Calditrichaceae bacterium]
MKKNLSLLATLLATLALAQQPDPMVNQRWNVFSLNKLSTRFNNTGMLCDGNNQNLNQARRPSFEYPIGSGLNWATCIGVAVGAPANQDPAVVGGVNPENLPYLDGTMDEGPADFWNEEHFAPYPEFAGNSAAPMSHQPSTWPAWPQFFPGTNIPVVVGSEGWPGFGPGGERLAEVESFSVVYGWGGTDQLGGGANVETRWLNTQMEIRGLAWSGSLYEDFIIWVYVVRNINPAPIVDMRMGIHVDYSFLPNFDTPAFGDADRHYYDPTLQLAYATDDDGYELSMDGRTLGPAQIAWGGVIALRMPGGDHGVAAYDASHFWEGQTSAWGSGGAPEMFYQWNLLNENDPHDSNGDGIDDDFDLNGVPDAEEGGPGYYVGSGADGLQILGSHSFTLGPGESDTLIFATVFGENQNDLFTNAKRAKALYETGWTVVTAPPAPVVEAKPGDRQVTLFWDNHSEKDPQFEGYKIYRSLDGGTTWGTESFQDFFGGVHYLPLEQYDLVNDIKGYYQTLPEYAWFYLGDDEWLPVQRVVEVDTFQYFEAGDTLNFFVDRDVVNGLEYRYYVAAYDSGNGIVGPLENTPATNPAEKNNAVAVIPRGAVSTANLEAVRVVPNPYFVTAAWDRGQERQVQFTHLPEKATIRIFNSAGEMVRELNHDAATSPAPSLQSWDLKNYHQQLVAPGVYFYHVESAIGETTGKFVIIL